MSAIETFMGIIEGVPLDRRQTEFVTAILSLLAMQLSRLTPDGQKQFLEKLAAAGGLQHLGRRLCCEGSGIPYAPSCTLH